MDTSAIEQELDLVEQATFTDPSDQSAWIYHRWLLSQAQQRYQEAQQSGSAQQSTVYQASAVGFSARVLDNAQTNGALLMTNL